MPFARNSDLPERVRDAIPSKRGKDLFRNVVNSVLDQGRPETVAFASAWAALEDAGFEQNSQGKWVRRESMTKGLIKVLGSVMKRRSKEPEGFLKVDDEQRIVWGWASVVTEKGEPVVDSQGDVITPEEMEAAANAFMLDVRTAKAMHRGEGIGEVIHSLPLTNELAKQLDLKSDREGWIIAMKIHDDDVWGRVKSGELRAFSIGGTAREEAFDA